MLDAGLPRRLADRLAARAVSPHDRRSPAAPGPQARRPAGPRRAAARRHVPLDRARASSTAKEAASVPTTPRGPPVRPGARRSSSAGRSASEEEIGERLSKKKALAIFSSDAISSSAYATEEILRVLILGGVAALAWGLWVSVAIAVLLIAVAISYRQICIAYPTGGGSYSVSKRNFGRQMSLIAASALMIDYVMTVAVSTASSIEQVTSADPRADRRAGHPRRRRDHPDHDRQPPRAARGRQPLRDPDLPVPRLGAADDRDRVDPDRRLRRARRTSPPASPTRSARASRTCRSSSSCGRSPPAPWP